jgi:hypothetical protein
MRTLLRASLPLLLAASACAGNTTGSGAAGDQARLVVENRSSVDFDIYAVHQAGRETRIGLALGGETTSFQLSRGTLTSFGSMTFQGRPARAAGGQPVESEPFNVVPGEEVTWSIPPQ